MANPFRMNDLEVYSIYHYFRTQRRPQATASETPFFCFFFTGLGGGDVDVPVNLLTSRMLRELRGWLGCTYIYIYVSIYIYFQTIIYIHINVHIFLYICIHIYIFLTYVYIYITCIYTCIYICIDICIYIYLHTYLCLELFRHVKLTCRGLFGSSPFVTHIFNVDAIAVSQTNAKACNARWTPPDLLWKASEAKGVVHFGREYGSKSHQHSCRSCL